MYTTPGRLCRGVASVVGSHPHSTCFQFAFIFLKWEDEQESKLLPLLNCSFTRDDVFEYNPNSHLC